MLAFDQAETDDVAIRLRFSKDRFSP